jgi:lysophospholipid acyltransferase (LPLAT)-like uncharacterized protein
VNLAEQSKSKPRVRSRDLKSSGIVVPRQPRFSQQFLAGLVYCFERVLTCSLRYRWLDRSGLLTRERTQPVIFCLWHNRLALSMAIFRLYVRRMKPDSHLAALVSASRDGAFLSAVLERFGVQPVRGSTSRRGPQALLELISWAEKGYDLAITPDGPRGPRHVVQEGVIALAQVTGLPLIPVSYRARRKVALKSWDRFQIPLPSSLCEMIFEAPVLLGRDSTAEEREKARLLVQKKLLEAGADQS